MKTWSNRKKWVIVGLVVVLTATISVLIQWPREPRALASIPYLVELPDPENRQGRFFVANLGTNLVLVQVKGTEFYLDGTWQRSVFNDGRSHLFQLENLSPEKKEISQFLPIDPPGGTNKWRGVLIVSEVEPRSGAFFPVLVSKFRGLRNQFRDYGIRGLSWPTDGPGETFEAVTSEVEP